MAFTQNPAISTYQTKRIQLTRELNSRSASVAKDEDYLNVFFEVVKNKQAQDSRHFVIKRPGIGVDQPGISSPVRGSIYWKDYNTLFYFLQGDLYKYVADVGITTAYASALPSTTGDVAMAEYLYPTGQQVILFTDGTTLGQIDSAGTITMCADAELPVHIPALVCIDGYAFVVKDGTGDIYNSDLDNPLSWTAGDFISAEMRPDRLRTIGRASNYLVALGTESIEYFWDAANVSGSPMQRTETPFKSHGYLGGKLEFGNALYFIGTTLAAQPSIYKLEDSKIVEVASEVVRRYLYSLAPNQFDTWKLNIVSIVGHNFLVVSAGSLTYVYDIDLEFWYRWSFDGVGTSLPILTVHNMSSAITYKCLFFLNNGTSTIYAFSPTLYQDDGSNFTCQITTEASDFDTMNRKTMARLSLIGDRPSTDAFVQLSWSDDDYQSFSQPLLANMNQDLPSYKRLGSFRQRIFKLTFTENAPLRLMEMEADINMGQS